MNTSPKPIWPFVVPKSSVTQFCDYANNLDKGHHVVCIKIHNEYNYLVIVKGGAQEEMKLLKTWIENLWTQ